MPIYEYKGQQYDIATEDHAEAKSKILSYLEKQAAPAQTPQQGERTWGEAATDIGAAGVSGLGKLIQFPGQLVGLTDRKSTRLNSSHIPLSRMPSSA